MKFGEKWLEAYESRDRDLLEDLIDDDFVYVRHQSGKNITKEGIKWEEKASIDSQNQHNNKSITNMRPYRLV